MIEKISRLIVIGSVVWVIGCAGLPTEEAEFLNTELPEPERIGVYHKIQKGQTLWRVAKIYDVAIDDIIRTNSIPDVAQLEENQLVFIPGVDTVREIILDTDETENEFIWPVQGKVVGYFHQLRGGKMNQGIDIKVPEGTIVIASRTGRVVFSDYLTGYGNTVIIVHTDGYYSIYSQNSEILTKSGNSVLKGDAIAKVGRRDRLAYLHFQIRKDSIENNPLHYLP